MIPTLTSGAIAPPVRVCVETQTILRWMNGWFTSVSLKN